MSGVLILEIGGSGGVGGFEIPPLKCRKISGGGGKGGFSVKNWNFLSVNTENFMFCAKNEFFQNTDLKREIFSIL